jgi:cytochrome c peroxidase
MKRFVLVTVVIVAVFAVTGQALAVKPSDMVKLGEELYTDVNLSLNFNQSCMTCHHPLTGFVDTSNHIDPLNSPVSDGSDEVSFGGRNAPSAAYAGFSPALNCVDDGEGGTFCTGGMFWDGRATGLADTDTGGIVAGGITTGPTYDPLADQAKGPFQNPIEMALTPDQLIARVRAADYAGLFKKAFGYNVVTEPAHIVYNDIGIAIAAFERSVKVNQFSSKFDQFVIEQGVDVSAISLNADGVVVDGSGTPVTSKVFMQEELEGLALFNMPNDNDGVLTTGEGGNCAACHPSGPITEPTNSEGKTLFTDFSYDNLGVPVNPAIADLAGTQPIDMGLYATLANLNLFPSLPREGTEGLFKVPTVRNVAQTAPYAHNGFFPTLKSIVHFYNARLVEDLGDPEVGTPNETELGDLGLSPDQEDKIVLFMETLTDR